MTDCEALRSSILQEVDTLGQKSRFGLFSSPISTAIGDNGPYQKQQHKKDQRGKPKTQPRGIYTNPIKNGQLNKSYFGPINSLATSHIKDQYLQQSTRLLHEQNQTFKQGFKKQQMFKPASGFKQIHKPSYEYKQQNNPEMNPKRNRDPDGKVKSQPRNYYTNQQSTIIKSYFKPIKYIDDPYQRKDQQQSQRLKRQRNLQGQTSFKLNLHPRDVFTKTKQTYGLDVNLPQKKIKGDNFNIYKHESKWKTNSPSKLGIDGFFSPFPTYMQNPPKQLKRKPVQQNKKDSFRRMSIASSKPSPSIAYNPINLHLSKTISHSVSYRN